MSAWYYFTSLAGKGKIVETTYAKIGQYDDEYSFRKSLLKPDGVGGYDGTIDLTDDTVDDEEEYICVVFEGEILKSRIECPGPYEIREHFVSITSGEDGQILLTSSWIL